PGARPCVGTARARQRLPPWPCWPSPGAVPPPLPVPPLGTPEQPLAPLSVTGRHLTRRALSTAGPGTGPGAGGGAGDGG
ncbi:hypothetical protein ACWEP3_24070, partial [Streptomyces albidoflavus]